MTGIMCAMVGLGGSNNLDTQTVLVGSYSDEFQAVTGFSAYYFIGSISDGTFNPKGGAAIHNLYYDSASAAVIFELVGSPLTNADWTTMKIGSTSFNRSAGTFSSTSGFTSWYWTLIATNPFTGDGTNTLIVFT